MAPRMRSRGVKEAPILLEWLYGKSRRINLKCLAVRSRNIGTLTIINNRHVHDNKCGKKSSVSEATTFDLGCRINQTSITVDSCLTMEFWKLSRHFDFKRSRIKVYWENICMHVFDASLTVRYSDPMKLILPVYRNGTYYIKATLACNASGEIEQNSLSLQKTVSNAESCGNFQPNLSSKCEDVKPKVGKVTILPPKKPLMSQIYTIITVISVLVTVGTVVTVAFIRKQRTISNRKRRSSEIGNPVEGEGLVFDTSL
ncbi:uncharacterized protein LOC132737621 [Ruditapes philippinarum]|uniref:uncharacterized protein LOC132737621 n=1 Tax=Ruditapes philippinarum TaxID=129788 RepID=UPI00295C21EA|nr:uncharacterized protein LOC132737621 [Ruditapes philippinarum]